MYPECDLQARSGLTTPTIPFGQTSQYRHFDPMEQKPLVNQLDPPNPTQPTDPINPFNPFNRIKRINRIERDEKSSFEVVNPRW
jgi:hypothetical protein